MCKILLTAIKFIKNLYSNNQ